MDPESDLISSLIQLLSPDRRRELLGVAVQNRFVDLVNAYQGKTVGEFFRAVQADPHWAMLKDLPLADVVSTSPERTPASAAPVPAAPDAEVQKTRLAVIEPLPASDAPDRAKGRAAAKAPAAPVKRQKRSGDIFEDILELVTAEPGLRNEEIQRRLNKPALLVKPTLAALRKQRRLRSEGTRRATRYYPAMSR
jgi:hypothetical protein